MRLDHGHRRRPSWRRRCPVPARYSRRRPPRASAAPRSSARASRRGDHRAAERQGRQFDRRRTGGDDDRLGAARSAARFRSPPRPSCRRGTAPQPATILTLPFFSRPATPLLQPADDAVLPAHGLARGRCRGVLGGNPERALAGRALARLVEFLGGVDQRLGRDAADVEAGAAELASPRRSRCRGRAARRGSRRHSRPGRRRSTSSLAGDLLHGLTLR